MTALLLAPWLGQDDAIDNNNYEEMDNSSSVSNGVDHGDAQTATLHPFLHLAPPVLLRHAACAVQAAATAARCCWMPRPLTATPRRMAPNQLSS